VPAKRFEVAFSLAGEQRDVIEPIARELRRRGHRVFFYAWPEHTAELAKPNLDDHLRRIYGEDAGLLVPVLSADYARKPWTGVVELTVVKELIVDRRDDEIMALRTDDAKVPGFSKLHGYIDVRNRSAFEIASLIERRLGHAPQDTTAAPAVRDRVLLYQTGGPREHQWGPAATRDEAFSQLWSIAAANFDADILEGAITADRLKGATCLVLTIGPQRTTHFREEEFDAVRAFVRDGQGLLLLGTYYGDRHHVANLSALAETFDIGFNTDVLVPVGVRPGAAGRADIRLDLTPAGSRRRGSIPLAPRDTRERALQDLLLARVRRVQTRDTCSLRIGDDAVGLLWSIPPNCHFRVPYVDATPRIDHDSWADGLLEAACIVAVSTRAKVVACGGWRTFSTTLLYEKGYDNQSFLENVLRWLATRASSSSYSNRLTNTTTNLYADRSRVATSSTRRVWKLC
jgi:hypothetical protein